MINRQPFFLFKSAVLPAKEILVFSPLRRGIKKMILFSGVYPLAKDTGRFEGYHPSGVQYKFLTCLGISSPSGVFLFDVKFAETADQKVVPPFETPLGDLQEGLNRVYSLIFS